MQLGFSFTFGVIVAYLAGYNTSPRIEHHVHSVECPAVQCPSVHVNVGNQSVTVNVSDQVSAPVTSESSGGWPSLWQGLAVDLAQTFLIVLGGLGHCCGACRNGARLEDRVGRGRAGRRPLDGRGVLE